MSDHPRADADPAGELSALVQRMCDGTASHTERDQLETLLRASRENRDFLRAYLTVHANLQWIYRGKQLATAAPVLPAACEPSSSDAATEPIVEGTAASEIALPEPVTPIIPMTPADLAPSASSAAVPVTPVPVRTSPVLGFLAYNATRLIPPLAMTTAATGLGMVIYFLFISWGMLDKTEVADGRPLAGEEQAGGGRREAGGEQVAAITGSEDARWLAEDGLAAASSRQPAIEPYKPLALAAGTVDLVLHRGTRVALEGPARWTVVDDNHIRLQLGTLLATVPSQAVGFTVETPTMKVVDLGTQFRVTVDPQGGTETRVVKGLIEVEQRDLATQSFGLSADGAIRLSAGQAVRIDHLGEVVSLVSSASALGEFRSKHTVSGREDSTTTSAHITEQEADDATRESVLRPLEQAIAVHLTNGDFEATPLADGTGTQRVQGWFESSATALGSDWVCRNSRILSNSTNTFGVSAGRGYIYQQIGTYEEGALLTLTGEIYTCRNTPLAEIQATIYVGNVTGGNGLPLTSLGAQPVDRATLSARTLAFSNIGLGRGAFSLAFHLDQPYPANVPLWLELSRTDHSEGETFVDNLSLTFLPKSTTAPAAVQPPSNTVLP